ncbi:hypothetical protein BH18ACT9_BH18ACT9_02390 [soil metagenome]
MPDFSPGPAPAQEEGGSPSAGVERTALAWRRTALAIVVAATLLARLVVDRLGAVGLVAVAVALPVGLWVFWQTGGGRRQWTASAAAALLATAVALLGAVEIGALAIHAAR